MTRPRGEGGNAMVEFVYLAVLLMVPLVYVLLSVFQVQRAAYAVSSAAREAGRVYAASPEQASASSTALLAARLVMRDSGLELERGELSISCPRDPCLQPGGRVFIVVTKDVGLPLLPESIFGRSPASVTVTGKHLQVVDRYRSVAP